MINALRPSYDLHIHSCLSPCADDDMTPANIAGMAHLNGLDFLALTDHNSTDNLPAFFECCRAFGIVPIAGIEVTTSEDIHLVVLFKRLNEALEFGKIIKSSLMPITNNPEIFGNQFAVDSDDNVIFEEKTLLITATSLSVSDVISIASNYGAVVYPAHIDRQSNGMAAILGDIPKEYGFKVIELNDRANKEDSIIKYHLEGAKFVYSSDAHHLWDINEAVNRVTLIREASGSEDEMRELFFSSILL